MESVVPPSAPSFIESQLLLPEVDKLWTNLNEVRCDINCYIRTLTRLKFVQLHTCHIIAFKSFLFFLLAGDHFILVVLMWH